MSTSYTYVCASRNNDTSAEIELLEGTEWGGPWYAWVKYFTITAVYHCNQSDPYDWFFEASVEAGKSVADLAQYVKSTFASDRHLLTPWSYATNAKIAGTITLDGSPLAGVSIFTGSTNANGNYLYTHSGAYSGYGTPSKTGYRFTPENNGYASVVGGTVDDYTAEIALPLKATDPYPADDATGVDFSPFLLTWNTGGDTLTYDVYLGPGGSLTKVSSAQVGTEYTTTAAELLSLFCEWPTNRDVVWRIDATNSYGTTTGDEWNFTPVAVINTIRIGGGGDFILCMTNQGLSISTDFGTSWSQVLPDSDATAEWDRGICSSTGTYIIVSRAADGVLYRSANTGSSWGTIDPTGGDTFVVNDMAMSEDGQFVIIVGTNSTTAADSCYISTNYGVAWTAYYPSSDTVTWASCDISNDGAVIVVGAEEYFYVSFDSGVSWWEQEPPGSHDRWNYVGLAGDGSLGIVANTRDANEFFKSSGWYTKASITTTTITSTARSILDDSTPAEVASTIGVGVEDSPTFMGLTLSGLTASRLLATGVSKELVSVTNLASWVAGTANEISVADDGDGTITIGLVDPLIVGKGGSGAATLTDHGILLGSGTDAITPLGAATDGQIPIGSTGADPVLATLTGTANQISVTNAAGSITLALTGQMDEIAALAVTDGNFMVGNGTTWVVESGTTARTSLGLGTGDSPQFTALTLTSTDNPLDAGGWTGKPDPIASHSNIYGDIICGLDGVGVARVKIGSNYNHASLQYNRYFDGTDNQQMNTNIPCYQILMGTASDYIIFGRAPAGEVDIVPILTLYGATYISKFAGGVVADTNTLVVDATNHRVGIGTSSPQRQLHIAATILPYLHLTNDLSGHTANDGMTIGCLGTGYDYSFIRCRENHELRFYTNDTQKAVIKADGKVGIGVAAPNELFEVNGKIRANTAFNLNGVDVIAATTANLPNVLPQTDNTHYLGKNDDDTPFAWKGLILKDQAGTGKYYRLEIVDDALVITDLTD